MRAGGRSMDFPETAIWQYRRNLSPPPNEYSPIRNKLGDGQTDVTRDLSQQDRRDIAAAMVRNSGSPTVRMTVLLV